MAASRCSKRGYHEAQTEPRIVRDHRLGLRPADCLRRVCAVDGHASPGTRRHRSPRPTERFRRDHSGPGSQGRIDRQSRLLRAPASGPELRPADQPAARRELHLGRRHGQSVRRPAHPRLRRCPHRHHHRRRAGQRLRQLRGVPRRIPDPGNHRPRHGQHGRDLGRQPDGLGGGRHGRHRLQGPDQGPPADHRADRRQQQLVALLRRSRVGRSRPPGARASCWPATTTSPTSGSASVRK